MRARSVCVFVATSMLLCAFSGAAFGATRADEIVATGGPVVSYGVSPDLNCQASYSGDVHGEFFGETACATVVASADGLYAPADIPAGSSLTDHSIAFTPVSQSSSGSGTAASPRAVTTSVRAGDLGLTQVDSYVAGSSRLQTLITVTNGGPVTQSFSLFRAGDCYAKDSDIGYGQMGPQSAACVSSVEARTVRFLATPVASQPQPGALTWQGYFNDLWSRIATFAPGGAPQDFDGGCRCAESIDNAAGLQWKLTLAPGQQATVRSAVDFGPIAAPGGFGTPSPLVPGGKPYVALGDSFSSGEGAGEQGNARSYGYFNGTDVKTGANRNMCHRSGNAYPLLVASKLALDTYADLDFRACSGAVIADLRAPNHSGNAGEGAQLTSLGADTRLVTLTIGGNDAHFADIVKACATPFASGCDSSKAGGVEADYNALSAFSGPQSLLQAYQEVIARLTPGANLVVLGYPDFTPFGGGCQVANRFSPQESTWLSGQIRRFNSLIQERAAMAGAMYVDVNRLFDVPGAPSHRVCGSDEWVNGVRNLRVGPPPTVDPESFHPNRLGQIAYADAFYRRYVLGDSNEALSGGGGLSFSRESEVAPATSSLPTTLVIRKGTPASLGIDVTGGHTTIASLRYGGATPVLALRDPAGGAVPLGSLTSGVTPAGASATVVGDTTVLRLRGLAAGHYTLDAQLPDAAPTDAGVLSARMSSILDENQPPIVAVRARWSKTRRLSASAAQSIDPEGGPLSYRWTFADGSSSTKAAPTHDFRRRARFAVRVIAKDSSGLATSRTLLVDSRPQTIGRLRAVRAGRSNRVRSTLTCTRAAVGRCDGQVTLVARSEKGRRVVRTIVVSAGRGRVVSSTFALPGSRRRPFVGQIRVTARVEDQAIRPARIQAMSVAVK